MSIAFSDVQPMSCVQLAPHERAKTQVGIFHCLILSNDPRRQAMFDRAASDGGWETILCDGAGQAAQAAQRFHCQLMIVDLDGSRGGSGEGHRELTEQLTRRGRMASSGAPLIMICGNDEDVLEEIWARQLGVWLYLPGVDATCDLAMLCGEARTSAEKLNKNGPQRASLLRTA